MICVTFIRPYSPYNVGEVAGFTAEQARRLIDSGIAEPVLPPAPAHQMLSSPPLDTVIHVPPLAKRRAR